MEYVERDNTFLLATHFSTIQRVLQENPMILLDLMKIRDEGENTKILWSQPNIQIMIWYICSIKCVFVQVLEHSILKRFLNLFFILPDILCTMLLTTFTCVSYVCVRICVCLLTFRYSTKLLFWWISSSLLPSGVSNERGLGAEQITDEFRWICYLIWWFFVCVQRLCLLEYVGKYWIYQQKIQIIIAYRLSKY